MTKEELIEFLKENLTISVSQTYEYVYGGIGPCVHVALNLQGEEISSDTYQLPSKD